jgi:hypothetical protein
MKVIKRMSLQESFLLITRLVINKNNLNFFNYFNQGLTSIDNQLQL